MMPAVAVLPWSGFTWPAALTRQRGHDALSTSGNPDLAAKTIEEPARQVPLYGEYEVAVLGGGPAGIAAAVAAARAGRRTLLI
ncbi:MAG: FAD-dependent oxidoreductase, partial [Bradyrhizobium sp.]